MFEQDRRRRRQNTDQRAGRAQPRSPLAPSRAGMLAAQAAGVGDAVVTPADSADAAVDLPLTDPAPAANLDKGEGTYLPGLVLVRFKSGSGAAQSNSMQTAALVAPGVELERMVRPGAGGARGMRGRRIQGFVCGWGPFPLA